LSYPPGRPDFGRADGAYIFEQQTGKEVELVQPTQDEVFEDSAGGRAAARLFVRGEFVAGQLAAARGLPLFDPKP
jgi:hypothetical protein